MKLPVGQSSSCQSQKDQPSGIEDVATNEMKVINGKGQVTIETAEAMPIAIYALTGAQGSTNRTCRGNQHYRITDRYLSDRK